MKSSLVFACLAITTAAFAAPAFRPADEAQIAQIAASLPEAPAAPGARIGDRAAWERLAQIPQAKNVIHGAEAVLREPIPELTEAMRAEYAASGNRDTFEGPYKQRLLYLPRLVLAEGLENQGRFTDKIADYLEAILAETTWVQPAHDKRSQAERDAGLEILDLGSTARALCLAYTLDWVGEKLPQVFVDRVRAELDRRIFAPYERVARATSMPRGNDWWFMNRNNWNAVVNGNVVMAALAVEPDRVRRARFIEAALRANPFYIAGFEDDGYCSEGIGYWNYGFGHQVKLGLAVRAATGGKVDFLAGEKQRRIMEVAYHFQLENGLSPDFADGMGKPEPVILALCRQAWPDCFSSAAFQDHLLSGGIETVALRAFGQEPPEAAPTMDRLPIRSWLPSAQVLIARTATDVPFALAAKGGYNNENHNHNDVGSYEISLAGESLAGDPGAEKYTAKTFSKARYESKINNSFGHPVPVVAGRLQETGTEYRAKIVDHSFSYERDTLTLDLSGAYKVPELTRLDRTFKFDRKAWTVTVTDHVEFSSPCAFSVPIISRTAVEALPDGASFLLRGKFSALKATVTASAPWTLVREDIPNPQRVEPIRLGIDFNEPVTSAEVTVVYHPEKL